MTKFEATWSPPSFLLTIMLQRTCSMTRTMDGHIPKPTSLSFPLHCMHDQVAYTGINPRHCLYTHTLLRVGVYNRVHVQETCWGLKHPLMDLIFGPKFEDWFFNQEVCLSSDCQNLAGNRSSSSSSSYILCFLHALDFDPSVNSLGPKYCS